MASMPWRINSNTNNNNHGGPLDIADLKSEYKRAFQWGSTMVGPAPAKPEPMISSYQFAYGGEAKPLGATDYLVAAGKSTNGVCGGGGGGVGAGGGGGGGEDHADSSKAGSAASSQDTIFSANGPSSAAAAHRDLGSASDSDKSEYHAKFKPFDDYVYVEGEGKFRKQTAATKLICASGTRPTAASATKSWFYEVEERGRAVCKYRARSQNGAAPVNSDHPWDGVIMAKDRNLQALSLATTQLIISEKRAERKHRSASAKPTNRSSGDRLYLNSAPSSLRDATGTHSVDCAKQWNASTDTTTAAAASKIKSSRRAPGTDRNNNMMETSKPTAAASGAGKPPMVPRKKVATTPATPGAAAAGTAPAAAAATGAKEKVWIKPAKKSAESDATKSSDAKKPESGPKAVNDNSNKPRPVSKPQAQAQQQAAKEQKLIAFDAEPKSVPLRTTEVKSPEQLSGIKSPSPESWTVSIEKGGLQWVNGSGVGGVGVAPVSAGDAVGVTHPVKFSDSSAAVSPPTANGDGLVVVKPIPR